MIPAKYIKTFLPIQELDDIKPVADASIAPLKPDDLMLVSQISAYATSESNAVAVSKKIRYEDLAKKISSDFNISSININIYDLSDALSTLSSKTETSVADLCAVIALCAESLSTYTNDVSTDLSTAIYNGYVAKYSNSYDVVVRNPNDNFNPASILSAIHVVDGNLCAYANEYVPISDLIVAKDWRISQSGIAGDEMSSVEYEINTNMPSYTYQVLSDCYLNCNISALEDDSYSALEIWLATKISEDGEAPAVTSSLYQTLNNPGGFSGKPFYNNYHFAIPVKTFQSTNNTGGQTSVIIKYADSNNNISAGSHIAFSQYYFYAIPAKDELANYVKKLQQPLQSYDGRHVCKIKYDNSTGQIIDAESVYYDIATSDNAGLVKLGATVSEPDYRLRIQGENDPTNVDYGRAYVSIPYASEESAGIIYVHEVSSNGNVGSSLSCGLQSDSNERGYVLLPQAEDNKYGVVKHNNNQIIYPVSDTSLDDVSSYLGIDVDGRAYTKIPHAAHNHPGVIIGGAPDTSDIRIIRSVYIDELDGRAKVNVVSNVGVGLFNATNSANGGYDISIEIPLSVDSTVESNNLSGKVFAFDGAEISCEEYGSYAYYAEKPDLTSWFTAALVYIYAFCDAWCIQC